MNFLTGAYNYVRGGVHSVVDTIHSTDSNHLRLKEQLKETAALTGLAGAVTGVATLAFASIALASGSTFAIGLSLAGAYIAYNGLTLATNMFNVAEKPSTYFSGFGLTSGLDTDLLKQDLSKGTFYFSKVLHIVVDKIDQAMVRKAR